MLKLRAMKYESPYQPWRADESWSFTLVGVLASHRFGSLQKPEKRHTTSRIFGLLDTGYIPVLPKSSGSYFPMFMGWGKLAEFYHWKNREKTQPDAAEMSQNVEMSFFFPWFRLAGV